MRKFVLFVMLALVSVVAWADGDYAARIVITQNDAYTVRTSFNKFAEPTVKVQSRVDGVVKDLTHLYNIKYYISGHESDAEASMTLNHRNAKVTTDATTGTQVELLFGDVITGPNAGNVTISIKATERANTSNVLSDSYTLTVQAPTAEVSFSPAFAKSGDDDVINLSVMQTVLDEWNNNKWQCRLSSASATFPNIRIIYKDEDITDKYTIAKILTKGDANTDYTLQVKTNTYDGQDYEQIVFTEFQKYNLESEDAAKVYFPSAGAYVTYTFTPQSGYPAIADKVVKINFNKFTEKQDLTLSLTQDLFSDLQNVTSHKNANGEDIYTIHVYKYGSQDHSEAQKYHYYQPHPTLTNTSGTSLPVNASRCAGTYGDFKYLYEVYDGKDGTLMSSSVVPAESANNVLLGTYYDDCQVAPFQAGTDYTKAGQSTGIMATSDYMFQSSKPGLVLVKVYAVLEGVQVGDEYVYGYDLRKLYNPIMDGDKVKVIEKNYTKYTVYSEPVYYYIDVMKRVPTLSFDPNPNDLTFGKNDRIDMTNRFNVSGYKDDSSNGIEGKLVWGGNDGFESDHFAYTFFISQHAAQVIKIHDWPCTFTKVEDGHTVADMEKWKENSWKHPATGEVFHGDQYSFISYQVVKSTDPIATNENAYLMPGDYKLLDNGTYELVTVGNQDRVKVGDKIKGITYNSVKGYGAAFEKWYMTFEHEGQYNITYTIRPWNHVRWDVGDDTAGTTTYQYNIVETMPTEIKLSYYETTTSKNAGSDFDEPDAKVVVTSSQNDVSTHFNFSYAIDPVMPHDGSTGYTITEDDGWSVYKKGSDVVLKVNTTTGEVFVGNFVEDVKVEVSATKKNSEDDPDAAKYENPVSKSYLIHVMDLSGNAKWEIISTCDPVNDTNASTNPRFTAEEFAKQSGRFHFIGAGTIVGGTQVRDVPGIVMTIGASGDEAWTAEISTMNTLKHCCAHEDTNKSATEGNPVVVDGGIASFDDDGIPNHGSFYQFQPTVSGFLALDANWQVDDEVILITKNSKTGIVSKEIYTVSTAAQDDHLFTMPLIAGQTYYVYKKSATALRLHGFTYQPAYVANASTTKTQSESGIEGTLFMNGFVTGVPTLVSGKNENVVYSFFKETSETADHSGEFRADASDYAEINPETGALTAKKMTIKGDGSIFYLKVVATVKSSNEEEWGSCTEKETFYYVRIIDIPTYKIENYEEYSNNPVYNRLKVRTTNIPTALTMTFGAWSDRDNKYNESKNLTDQWSYKSVGGPASRIGSELEDDDPTYNLTIDGFTYFNAGNNNPVDENNQSALQKNTEGTGGNDNSYKYASGTAAETSTTTYYNTTYKLPCRGAFLKFEPEESGTLLLYIVQNGSCDYHYGIEEVTTQHQLKWRPLYITDETGKPVDMLDALEDHVSSLLPMDNTDGIDIGAYTLGLSRCNKIEPAVKKAMDAKGLTPQAGADVCSFDWTDFRGTTDGPDNDRTKLLNAWPNKGQREKVIRLSNGGFALPHKAYVRYAFNVKAGKTYFVFQPGSKFEFGGFSFVPVNYPAGSKYGLTWADQSDEDMLKWTATETRNIEDEVNLCWTADGETIEEKNNANITIIDAASGEKTRKCTAGKWNSICLPFSVNESQLTKLFGKDYVLVTCDGVVDGELQFTRHANAYIEAGRPYLFKPTETVDVLKFNNVSIEAEVNTTTLSGTSKIIDPSRFDVPVEGFTFKGFYTSHEMPKGAVYASSNGLYMYNGGTNGNTVSSIGGYRALFSLPEPKSSAKAMTFHVKDLSNMKKEEQTTGIIYVANDDVKTLKSNVAIFTIDGKKVGEGVADLNRLGKGIYIVDGQKIVK